MNTNEGYIVQTTPKEYFPWVDVCKGALLYLVMIGHLWYSASPAVVNTIIYSFHMPAFFILSGYVLNTSRKSKRTFIKQKIFSLLIPAYICIILTLPLYIKGHGINFDLISSFFYVHGSVPYNAPCWFFITLFMAMCIVCLMNISVRTTCVKILMGGGSFVMGAVLYYSRINYFGVTKLFIALGFLILGVILRDMNGVASQRRKRCTYIAMGVLLVVWMVSCLANGKISLYATSLGNYLLFLLAGVCGSLCFMHWTKHCLANSRWKDYLIRVGNNTVLIVGTHYVIVGILAKMAKVAHISGTWIFGIIVLLLVPIIMAMYIPVSEFITKRVPILNGKMKINK